MSHHGTPTREHDKPMPAEQAPRPAPLRSVLQRDRVVTLLVMLGVCMLQYVAWQAYRGLEQEQAQATFARTVDQAALSLTRQTEQYRSALLGLRALYVASDSVTGHEFSRYAQALGRAEGLQGVRAFAFNRDLPAHARDTYISALRKNLGSADAAYAAFDIYPPSDLDRLHVVEMIHPPIGNQRSLGYDLNTSDIRRAAIARARDRGFAATPPLRLQQAPEAIAVLMLAPVVNQDGAPAHTVAASFLVSDLVNAAITPTLRQQFHLQITDLGADSELHGPGEMLYEDTPVTSQQPLQPAVYRDYNFGGRQWQMRFIARNPDTTPIPTASLILLSIGGILMAGAISHLVQQRVHRAARHRALASMASDCVLEVNALGTVTSAGESTTRITGLVPACWQGHALWFNIVDEDAEVVEKTFRDCIAERKPVTLECRVKRSDDSAQWVEMRLDNHLDHHAIHSVLVQVSDIDARKQAEAEVARLAFFDPLTGLPNRRLLEQRAELTFSTAKRHRGRAAVIVLDLDGFKQINDNAGHAVGDIVLSTIARRLQAAVRDSDTVARLGGDEFAILLGEPANEVDVRAAANRLARDLNLPLNANGRNWFVSASIGIALYPDNGELFSELLSLADAAMYRSKRNGNGLISLAPNTPPPLS